MRYGNDDVVADSARAIASLSAICTMFSNIHGMIPFQRKEEIHKYTRWYIKKKTYSPHKYMTINNLDGSLSTPNKINMKKRTLQNSIQMQISMGYGHKCIRFKIYILFYWNLYTKSHIKALWLLLFIHVLDFTT